MFDIQIYIYNNIYTCNNNTGNDNNTSDLPFILHTVNTPTLVPIVVTVLVLVVCPPASFSRPQWCFAFCMRVYGGTPSA